jgi:hypothetical protein
MYHRLITLIRAAVANERLKPEYAPHWEGLARGMASQQNHAGIKQLTAELEQTERHKLDRDPLEILGIGPDRFERIVKSVQVEIHVSQNAFAFQRSAVQAWTNLRIVKEPGCIDLRVKARGTAHDGFITVGHISSKNKGGVTKALEHDLLFWEKPYRATATTGFCGGGAATPTLTALINIVFEPPHYLIWPEDACKECDRFEFITRSMAAGAKTALPRAVDQDDRQAMPTTASSSSSSSACCYFSDEDEDASDVTPSSFELALLELEDGGRVAHDGASSDGGDEAPMTRALTAGDFRTAEMASDALARIAAANNEKSKRKPFDNAGKPTNKKTRQFVAFAEAGGGGGAGAGAAGAGAGVVAADHPLDEVLSRKAVCKKVNASAGSSPLARSQFEDGLVTNLVKQFLHYTDPQEAKEAAEDIAKQAMWESGHAVEDAELAVEEAEAEATAEAEVTQLCLHGCGQPTYHPNSQTCNRDGTCSEM